MVYSCFKLLIGILLDGEQLDNAILVLISISTLVLVSS